jgi:hypothetical protein
VFLNFALMTPSDRSPEMAETEERRAREEVETPPPKATTLEMACEQSQEVTQDYKAAGSHCH